MNSIVVISLAYPAVSGALVSISLLLVIIRALTWWEGQEDEHDDTGHGVGHIK